MIWPTALLLCFYCKEILNKMINSKILGMCMAPSLFHLARVFLLYPL